MKITKISANLSRTVEFVHNNSKQYLKVNLSVEAEESEPAFKDSLLVLSEDLQAQVDNRLRTWFTEIRDKKNNSSNKK